MEGGRAQKFSFSNKTHVREREKMASDLRFAWPESVSFVSFSFDPYRLLIHCVQRKKKLLLPPPFFSSSPPPFCSVFIGRLSLLLLLLLLRANEGGTKRRGNDGYTTFFCASTGKKFMHSRNGRGQEKTFVSDP